MCQHSSSADRRSTFAKLLYFSTPASNKGHRGSNGPVGSATVAGLTMAKTLPILACVLLLAASASVRADDDVGQGARARLEAPTGWARGTIAEQLDQDPSLIPFGKGAIFVPCITNPLDEPPVSVYKGRDKVAEAQTCGRITLDPGKYKVRIGSGSEEQRIEKTVVVEELHTTVVPVDWSSLSVHVVDRNFNSLRASYELIRMDDRQYMGIGFGADEQAGEPIATWIVTPGLYRIVRVGETYRARTDFATVRLLPRKHTDFLLVLDDETGEFKGGGEVESTQLFFRTTEGFSWNTVIGGDASLNSRENVTGQQSGETLNVRGFADTRINAQFFDSPFITILEIEEGLTQPPGQPLTLTRDRAELDSLYVYRMKPWLGPYIRFVAETNLFDGRENFNDPSPIRVIAATPDADGNDVVLRESDLDTSGDPIPQESIRLRPSFGQVRMREGVGFNIRPIKTLAAEGILRLGIGARHVFTNDLRVFSRTENGYRVYRDVEGFNQPGVETTLIARGRIARYVLLSLEVDSLLPFASEQSTIIEVEGTVNIKLTEYASINYILNLERNAFLRPEAPNQLEQDVLLRFSVSLP